MTVPLELFELLVYGALAVSVVTPVTLLVLFFRDRRRGELW